MSLIVKHDIHVLIDQWLKDENKGVQFPVDFDTAWAIAGYSDTGKGKRRLINLKEGSDYIVNKGEPIVGAGEVTGRSCDIIYLSIAGLVKFLLSSHTAQARNIVFEMMEYLTGLVLGTVSASKDQSGFVYLVKQSANPYYKIGKSKKPYLRLQTLQTSSPLELTKKLSGCKQSQGVWLVPGPLKRCNRWLPRVKQTALLRYNLN